VDKEYFESVIRPLLAPPDIEYLGEINDREKNVLLGQARGLLFPIDWPEPFGLVMIEAMACGTPVVSRRNGSVPEVLEHGITGFIADTIDELVEAVRNLPSLSRRRCRGRFEERFSARRMAEDYVRLYDGRIRAAGTRDREATCRN